MKLHTPHIIYNEVNEPWHYTSLIFTFKTLFSPQSFWAANSQTLSLFLSLPIWQYIIRKIYIWLLLTPPAILRAANQPLKIMQLSLEHFLLVIKLSSFLIFYVFWLKVCF